ncbi:HD domain-containing phosphohydrolase [Clostridium sp. HMP27]|uniref:bifunctional diguanylate cyclase/phosphohydrolase n=1 Tax=Clostridium sp. HMP27 TaxID=1487921 RepID=UPI000689336C|nr:HD domain-containing phosphohydrolase [Clostridium sp. HMP27]
MLENLKKFPATFIFSLFIFTLSLATGLLSEVVFPSLICSLVFAFALITAIYIEEITFKYILCVISLIVLVTQVVLFGISFTNYASIIFYVPIIYVYIVPSIIFPNLASVVLSLLFFRYKYFESSQSLRPFLDIMIYKIMPALVLCSILFTTIGFLIRQLVKERDKYKELSIIDSLTGLPNLSYLINLGEKMYNRHSSITIFIIDIDNFKHLNDTYGHLIGNNVLIQMGRTLDEELMDVQGIVGRLGGDEYVALVENLAKDEAHDMFLKLNQSLASKHFKCDPALSPITISCSIGMSYAENGSVVRLQELLHLADMNMYYNKQKSRGSSVNLNSTNLIQDKYKSLLITLAEKDMYSYVHSQYVVYYAVTLATALDLPSDTIDQIYLAGWFHDIGKILIPNDILRKKSPLTNEEYNLIKGHVVDGLNILERFQLSDVVINSIKYHHARYDGKGYPFEIKGQDTPIEAKILQIADAFSAMTVKRVYRELMSEKDALQEICSHKGTQFDPEIVDIFVKTMKS